MYDISLLLSRALEVPASEFELTGIPLDEDASTGNLFLGVLILVSECFPAASVEGVLIDLQMWWVELRGKIWLLLQVNQTHG